MQVSTAKWDLSRSANEVGVGCLLPRSFLGVLPGRGLVNSRFSSVRGVGGGLFHAPGYIGNGIGRGVSSFAGFLGYRVILVKAVLDAFDHVFGLVLAGSECLLRLVAELLGLVLQLIQKPML